MQLSEPCKLRGRGNQQVEFWLIIFQIYYIFQSRMLLEIFYFYNLGQIREEGAVGSKGCKYLGISGTLGSLTVIGFF